jgi:hypothetical protein
MPAPFYSAIKGVNSGSAAGTGAFTPGSAPSGYRAWSLVPTGWFGKVRFEDGTDWELCYCFWTGTTLTRAAQQVFDSSTGSQLSLTTAATASMIVSAEDIGNHWGRTRQGAVYGALGGNALVSVGLPTFTAIGTATAKILVNGQIATSQPSVKLASATTANAQAGVHHASAMGLVSVFAGIGGMEVTGRFGVTTLPTNPKMLMGMTTVTWAASAGEPSALAASMAAFGKDSTDATIKLFTKDGTTINKVDTGISLGGTGYYEFSVWCEPGSNKVYGLLVRYDTQEVWFGSTTTNCPNTAGANMLAQMIGGLSSTTGTAFTLDFGSMAIRAGT